MVGDISPSKALLDAFQRAAPRELGGTQPVPSSKDMGASLLKAFAPLLKDPQSGVRIFIFNDRGQMAFSHFPPELVNMTRDLWTGSQLYMEMPEGPAEQAAWRPRVAKAWKLLLTRFHNAVTPSSLNGSDQFNLVVPTEYSSNTYLFGKTWAGKRSSLCGVHLEVDPENLDQNAIRETALRRLFHGIGLAAVVDSEGLTLNLRTREPFFPEQSFSFPPGEDAVGFFPEEFFLQRRINENGNRLVPGVAPPAWWVASPTARYLVEILAVLLALMALRRLAKRWSVNRDPLRDR